MREIGLDISAARPKKVDAFVHQPFDFVITVCDNARGSCPVFTGRVTRHLHIGFDDPAEVRGTEGEIAAAFRRVRDEIGRDFRTFYDAEVRALVRD
jgi:arsenate reductase